MACALIIASRPVSGDRTPVRVVIKKGSTAGEIAGALGEKHLIRSPFLFKLTCRLSGKGAMLKPGVYELNRAMSISAIIAHLTSGDSLENWVTVPEGFTARQVGDLLESKQIVKSADFTELAIRGGVDVAKYAFIEGDNLEGYLFPDTYLVARGADCESIIKIMLDTFDKKVISSCRADIERTIKLHFGMGKNQFAEGLHKLLTMASLVEREAKRSNDRAVIAAVLWNRLNKHMRLEICATLSYIPGESANNKNKVYYKDTLVDSPYNTYKRFGLPPAPICNPGLASIKAVLNPANADYLFYVARNDGSHVFSRTYAQHLAAKRAIENGGK
ncbi:MAG: endolytic transglycosylase MltG [Armatimonadetes bacterium]|nr:endolytic transglycosylase MltG [Armatimonadota bacterium]